LLIAQKRAETAFFPKLQIITSRTVPRQLGLELAINFEGISGAVEDDILVKREAELDAAEAHV